MQKQVQTLMTVTCLLLGCKPASSCARLHLCQATWYVCPIQQSSSGAGSSSQGAHDSTKRRQAQEQLPCFRTGAATCYTEGSEHSEHGCNCNLRHPGPLQAAGAWLCICLQGMHMHQRLECPTVLVARLDVRHAAGRAGEPANRHRRLAQSRIAPLVGSCVQQGSGLLGFH